MIKYCATSCDSYKKMYHTAAKISPEPHLYLFLRNNIYYVRYELEKVNGKRRFKRLSLNTQNYFIAREYIMDMEKYIKKIYQLCKLYDQLKLEKIYTKNSTSTTDYDYMLSKDNDIDLLRRIKSLYDECFYSDLDDDLEYYKQDTQAQIISSRTNVEKITRFSPNSVEERKIWKKCLYNVTKIRNVLEKVSKIIFQIQNILYPDGVTHSQNKILPQAVSQLPPVSNIPVIHQSNIPHHTIKEIIDLMIIYQKERVNADGRKRNKKEIENLLSDMNISIDDEYNKINNQKTINQIEAYILKIPGIGAKAKNRRIRLVNELTVAANKVDPDFYKKFTIDLRPENSITVKTHKKTYLPFSKAELIKMFNPEKKFFKKYPDIFYSVLIGMFCGGRTNGTTTLRYTDIIDRDGIKCFDFKLDDDDEKPDEDTIKKLKNSSTVRTVPLHSRLIELGFLKYIHMHQKRNESKFQNFIFRRTLSISEETKEQVYNTHFFRPFFDYLRKLGIKKDRWKAFHSFRNTISNALDDCGISDLYAKEIVGWKGNDTRSKHYSTRELEEIQHELEKLKYPFLDESLDKIANDIRDKYSF